MFYCFFFAVVIDGVCVCVCQVSESGKDLLDILQRCPATTDCDEVLTQPDFTTQTTLHTAATHGIMGVLHNIMQVSLSVCLSDCLSD